MLNQKDMFCKDCGKEIADDSIYCQYCGCKNVIEKDICIFCQEKQTPVLDFNDKIVSYVCLKCNDDIKLNKCPYCQVDLKFGGSRCSVCGCSWYNQEEKIRLAKRRLINKNIPIKCPKCKSSQITSNKKGFSIGKAIAGNFLVPGIGLLAGLHGNDKIKLTCLKCGNQWEI